MKTGISKNELTAWVHTYTEELYAWAFHKTSNQELAEDLVQDTFLAAAESGDGFKRESQPKTWLFGILKNKIAAHYRKTLQNTTTSITHDGLVAFFEDAGNWNKNALPKQWPAASEHLTDNPAFNQVFDGCIENLPAVMNTCIRLRFIDEKKGEEICQEVGISSTNYWQIIRRAKLHLRGCLEKHWFNSAG